MAVYHFNAEKILQQLGFESLTPMQQNAIEEFVADHNIILSAPTGSGKTIAFLLMLLKEAPQEYQTTFALIITPTRELALQITDVFKKMKTGLKVTTCYGGHKREIEENDLKDAPAILIGTPGRIGDHLRRGNLQTSQIKTLVLDEFDKSLELGFQEEITSIIQAIPTVKERILVSATPLNRVADFFEESKFQTIHFESAEESKLTTSKINFSPSEKEEALLRLLCSLGNKRSIIFANQKETVNQLRTFLSQKGIPVVHYHGSLEQRDRETSIAKFRNGTSLLLVTTDLASRGLDIAHVRYIIHYDLPETEQIFIHRNGRSARMEASGDVILMISTGRESYPAYLPEDLPDFSMKEITLIPDRTEWSTLYVSAGKKDKVNKIDIVGYLIKNAGLKKEDIGIIEVKDFYTFVAIRRSKMNYLLGQGKNPKIKNIKVKLEIAK